MKNHKLISKAFAVCCVFAMASTSFGAFVQLDVVDGRAHHQGDSNTSYNNNLNGNFANVLEGDGLDTSADPTDPNTWTHDDSWQRGWQGQNLRQGWIIADFGSAQSLGNMYIWNENEVGNRGMATIDIFYTDAATVPNSGVGAFDFTAAGWSKFNAQPLALPAGTSSPTQGVNGVFDLAGTSARYVAIQAVTDNGFGRNRLGLAEIVFAEAAEAAPSVPEPATATLALLGLGGLMVRRRRTA